MLLTPYAPGVDDLFSFKEISWDVFELEMVHQQCNHVGLLKGLIRRGECDIWEILQLRRQLGDVRLNQKYIPLGFIRSDFARDS